MQSQIVVAEEVAIEEVNSWLDYKKISVEKREDSKEQIKTLVTAIKEGSLKINEDKSFTHKLVWPFGGEKKTTELNYFPRLTVGAVHKNLERVKGTDVDARLMAYVCALTNQSKDLLKHMDVSDYSVSTSIAMFFL